MYYEKKIKYLDYYENGERIRSGGFLKLEAREDMLRLELTVKGLYPTDSFVRDVLLRSGGREAALGQVNIQNGSGSFQYVGRLKGDIGSTGISYEALREIRIPIGGTRELVCPLAEVIRTSEGQVDAWQPAYQVNSKAEEGTELLAADRERKPVEALSEELNRNLESDENLQPAPSSLEAEPQTRYSGEEKGIAWETDDIQMMNIVDEKGDALERRSEPAESNAPGKNGIRQEGSVREKGDIRKERSAGEGKSRISLREEKWQQLSAIYPHIQPFQDERDYLSISPADFVLFPSKFYRAVNNSFLLHGYYNYDHLILARMEQRGEIRYYIGVPGNYYDREKQVAIMFGFESFECAAEPAKTGDFGYYMMRTEL